MKIASTLLVLVICGAACSAHAAPVGRSAKMAAQLKNHPTSAWLAHYLPDDRYKIAGGIWKYVATDLDTYYHRPDSPNMLRQPADRVIGFASAADAEDAGYRPDASVFSGPLTLSQASGASFGGRRIMLSDRMSSIVLPNGWKRLAGNVENSEYGVGTTDELIGPKGQRLRISTQTLPDSSPMDFSQLVSVEAANKMMDSLGGLINQLDSIVASTGSVNSRFNSNTFNAEIKKIRKQNVMSPISINGFRGVLTRVTARKAGEPSRNYSFGRRHKAWVLDDFSSGRTNLLPVIKTMQFR